MMVKIIYSTIVTHVNLTKGSIFSSTQVTNYEY